MKLEAIDNSMFKFILTYLIKNISLFILAIMIAWLTSSFVGDYFCKITECGGSWIDVTPFIGLLISYPFFVSLIFTLTKDRWKYFWSGGIFIGIFILFHFYEMPRLFLQLTAPPFLMGWLLGLLILKFLPKINISHEADKTIY